MGLLQAAGRLYLHIICRENREIHGKGRKEMNYRSFRTKILGESKKGFVLLEILLSLTLFSMVAALVLHFYSLGFLSYARGSTAADLQQNGRASMMKIYSELRWAEAYNIYASGRRIEFTLPDDPRKYTFRISGQDLEFIINSSVTKVAYHVHDLQFIPSDHNTMDYQITLSHSGQEFILFSTVKLKNQE